MSRRGFFSGVWLVAAGLLLLLLIAMGIGLTPYGTNALLLGVDIRSCLTVAAGLCLAIGITLVDLGFDQWLHPIPKNTPDPRHEAAASWRLR